MHIPSPSEIAFDAVTINVVDDVARVARVAQEVNALRPLSSEITDRIEKDLRGDRVYHSNAIEGNRLTRRETVAVLDAGAEVDVGRRRDAKEALNLNSAIMQVQEMVDAPARWSALAEFLAVHRILLSDVNDAGAGNLRDQDVMLTGAKYQPPRSALVSDLVDEFLELLVRNDQPDAVLLSTWCHWAIARIHPFVDGNGRMARLWQDLILFGNRYTAAVIRATDRADYYEALGAADGDDFNPLAQLIARSVSTNLQVYLNAAREADELRGWAQELVGESHARVDENRKLEYIRWCRVMEQVRDAFHRCAVQVTDASDGTVEIQIKPYTILDQSTWESLRSGVGATRTWFFWLNFRRGGERIGYCFFFGHHLHDTVRDSITNLGPSACLLISEQSDASSAVRLDQIEGSPLSIRELLAVDSELIRKRFNPTTELMEFDTEMDPVAVARDFISKVLLRRL